jgi:hypothetical protein
MRAHAPLSLVLVLLACSSDKTPTVSHSEDTGVASDDSASVDDSAGPVDSGKVEDTAAPSPHVEATLTEGEAVICVDPGARELGPVYIPHFGPDWSNQPFTAPSTDPLAAGGMTVADLTGDGRLDVYLPHIGADRLYVGQPDGTLADESDARLATDGIPSATAAAAVDIEGDGDLDLFITTTIGENRLLLNDGAGYFTDATEAAGLGGQGWPGTHGIFGDMDGDGDLDLFVVTFRNCDPDSVHAEPDPENPWADTPQALWENQGDGTFIDVSDRITDHPGIYGRMRAAAWIDVDGDIDLDLHIVSDHPWGSECTEDNQLYRNEEAHFTDAGAEMFLDLRMEGMGLAIGDLNEDGTPDFAMSDMQRMWMVESDSMGGWYNSTLVRGLEFDSEATGSWTAWGTELADLDNDGDLDLYMSFGWLSDAPASPMNPENQPDMLFIQDSSGTFSEVGASWGVDDVASNRAVVMVDMDGDGWLDLGRRTINGDAAFWMSRCGDAAWLKVYLEAPGPNPRGVGAVVLVRTGDRTQRRWLTVGGTGLQSSTELVAHFGLGDAESVDLLEVQWPDGVVSQFTDVGTKRSVVVARSIEE